MKRLKILIVGYYGSDNLGDEMLLKATINLLNKTYDNPEITAITYSVKNTRKTHGINGISRNKYFQILKGIKRADIVVGGGGSMLQNVTSNRSLIYYLTILSLSKLLGKRVVLLGNGIGPLKHSLYLRLTVRILKHLDAIVLRDEASYNFLKSHDLNNIYLGNDLVFTLDMEQNVVEEPKKIIFNLRKWFYDEGFIITIEKFIEYLANEGFCVALVPFQKGNDDRVLRGIEKNLNSPKVKLLENLDYEDLMAEIASCQLFIGMRLHGLIFSSIFKKPFIALSYDPKVSIFSKNLGQVCFEDLNNITLDSLIMEFNRVYSKIDDYKETLVENTKKILDLNHINEEVLKKLIHNRED
ncbi:MAG: polysaccharide pyruvyl transferase CsaB [Tissierellia bacterium]|nr:polysaccharide pyruvyl transferase CsaB [Tissierellia bacterium]